MEEHLMRKPQAVDVSQWRDEMSPKERVMAAIRRQETDRPACGSPTSMATVECMDLANAWFPEVHQEGEGMAALGATSYTVLGFDTIAPVFSVQQEAAALGAEVDWGTRAGQLPVNTASPWQTPDDVVLPADFLDRPPMKAVIDAIKILKKQYGDRVAIIGKAMGPWTLTYHLRGVQDFLLDVIIDPDAVRDFLDRLVPVTILSAQAQFEAGADIVCIPDHTTGDLVRAETYRDFLLPVHQRMVPIINAMGPTIQHCCGRTLDRMEYFSQSGYPAYHFESRNDAREAIRIVNGRMALAGNVNAPETILQGTPEDVRREALYAMAAGVDLVGPECAIPAISPNANLVAISAASREFAAAKRRGVDLGLDVPPVVLQERERVAELERLRAAAAHPAPA
jgi:MtaA/CmuA family methyltransferase